MGGKDSGAFLKFAPQTDTCLYSKFVRTPKYFVSPKVGRRVRTAQNRATRRFKKEAKSAPISYENARTGRTLDFEGYPEIMILEGSGYPDDSNIFVPIL